MPIETLQNYLASHFNDIHHIHPNKMEDLVHSVFSDFFSNCEVKQCGRSHDGGIDLILIMHEKKYAVQVKRRRKSSKTEPVSLIREFLGAIQLGDMDGGLFVTTADKFSGFAHKASTQAVDKKLVSKFDLINKDDFLSMLGAVKKTDAPPWAKHLPHPFNN